MSAISSWTFAVGGVLVLAVGLHHLGYDVTGTVGNLLKAVEHLLGHPLLPS